MSLLFIKWVVGRDSQLKCRVNLSSCLGWGVIHLVFCKKLAPNELVIFFFIPVGEAIGGVGKPFQLGCL